MTDWYVGQKVVCVVRRSLFWVGPPRLALILLWRRYRLPRKSECYEVARVGSCAFGDGDVGLGLKGFAPELTFNSRCFRPLVSLPNISVFHDILARLPAHRREAAR